MAIDKLRKIIIKERIYRQMTEHDLAREIPMNYTSYNKFENGHRELTFSEIISICRILKIDLTKEFEILEKSSN